MIARQKLIEAMIENNMHQMRFESARGGAEIERACALRDLGLAEDRSEPTQRLAELDRRIERLYEDQSRLAIEREWLNQSLFEFDRDASDARGKRQLS